MGLDFWGSGFCGVFVEFSFCDRPMAFQVVDLQRMHLNV